MSRAVIVGWVIVLVVGCSGGTGQPVARVNRAPSRAGRFDRAEELGCWFLWGDRATPITSDVYATFRDGTALTPLVTCALQDNGQLYAIGGMGRLGPWFAKTVRPDGTIDEPTDGFPYPVYTAALSLRGVSHPTFGPKVPEVKQVRAAWLKYLLERQLTEQNGWHPDDKPYGGWGYYPRRPKKPTPGQAVPAQHLLESNLSATAFALDALRAAGHADPQTYRKALAFVRSCQNADGGFHFIYDDPVRNKAGLADPGTDGRPRYRSYGSATADGLRALLHCGLKPNAPDVVTARHWLVTHFTADSHPGDYAPAFEPTRNAVYFYYAASVARTFRVLGVKEVRGRHWADTLADALLARQKPDGSWANDRDQQRENDPLVATAYAVSALAECRRAAR